MGERKVLNKYYPPDFDPSKLPRAKRTQANDMKVRMMLPMSVRCKTCGNFMYKGTKFNTRKEDVLGEDYLGIQIFRFYWRCKKCSAEFCMKTDPKNADYILEAGATRNYEPWRDEEATKADAVKEREEEEMGNAMKALENRTLDSKREMDIMAALDEMRALKSQHARVTTEQALAALQKAAEEQGVDPEDAEDVAAFYQLRAQANTKRLSDSSSSDDEAGRAAPAAGRRGDAPSGGEAGGSGAGAGEAGGSGAGASGSGRAAAGGPAKPGLPVLSAPAPAAKPAIKVMVKPKAKPVEAAAGKRPAEDGGQGEDGKKARVEEAGGGAGGLGLLGAYGSSSDSEGSK